MILIGFGYVLMKGKVEGPNNNISVRVTFLLKYVDQISLRKPTATVY